MRTPRGWGRVAGLALVALVACSAGHQKPKPPPDYSAEQLAEPALGDSVLDLLEPEEREAVERSGMTGARPVSAPAAESEGGPGDTAGKVGLSLLTVAVSIGAAV